MNPINYCFDEENNVMYEKCTGHLSLEDLIKHANNVILDPKFRETMNTISDISEAELEYSFVVLSEFRNHLKRYEPIRGDFKWAILSVKNII